MPLRQSPLVLQWEEGSYHGVGVERFARGSAYHGGYVRGVRQGYGVCHYYNKDYFEGQWAGGLRNGRGGHSLLAEGSPACRCLGPLLEQQLLAHQTLQHLVALLPGSSVRSGGPCLCIGSAALQAHRAAPSDAHCRAGNILPPVTSLFPMWMSSAAMLRAGTDCKLLLLLHCLPATLRCGLQCPAGMQQCADNSNYVGEHCCACTVSLCWLCWLSPDSKQPVAQHKACVFTLARVPYRPSHISAVQLLTTC